MWRARSVLLAAVVVLSGVPATASPIRGPVFEDGAAQPVFNPDRAIRQSAFVTAPVDSDRDGRPDRVHVEVVRPAETARGLRTPVVFQASPYYAGGNDVANHNVDRELYVPDRLAEARAADRGAEPGRAARRPAIDWEYERYLVARGYTVVYGESLGTGQSTGCPTTGGKNETIGARSVVDWLNGRAPAQDADGAPVAADWSTGKVGMMGVSYNGTLPNAVASTGVPGLEAIVPIAAISNWYDYYRNDGAVVAPGGYQGEDADVLAKYVYTRDDREVCRAGIDELAARQDRLTGDMNPFWDERDYLDDVHKVRAAVLSVHGLNDDNVKPGQAAQWYAALRKRGVPHKIWWHQSGHEDPLTLRRDAWLRELNRWFTRYLYGVRNGVEQEPRATIQREDGSWTTEAEWPAPRTEDVTVRPTPGGRDRGGLTTGDSFPATESLQDDARKPVADLAAAPSSPHRLAYFSKPTTEPLRLSGSARADLALTFDRPAANVTMVLVDRAPDGTTTVINRGWRDPQNRHSIRRTSPIEPGRSYFIPVRTQPDDYVLATGHQLGIVLLSSDHHFTLRPRPGTGLTLDLARSEIRLPIVGGERAWPTG